MNKAKADPNYKVIAENRRARFDYAIESDLECGVVLLGSEVKSLRNGGSNIAESYAQIENGELWLVNSYVAPYEQAKTWGHQERRKRKLLASKKELSRLWNDTQRKGMTLVPLVIYFNHTGRVKIKIGIAKGKKIHDKRADEAKRDWGRQKQRLLRQSE
ncbi:MAG: SsrA-binding protein SmpB [Paracoccaceae bacterium]|jgi:SsrA-binding protein